MEKRGGDFPLPDEKTVAGIVLLSGLQNVPRVDELKDQAAEAREIESPGLGGGVGQLGRDLERGYRPAILIVAPTFVDLLQPPTIRLLNSPPLVTWLDNHRDGVDVQSIP